jgi:sRNA-binding carbon storage regulator CsrA
MKTSLKNTSKQHAEPTGLSLERRRGQSITLPEIGIVIHVTKVYAGKVQLVFESKTDARTPIHRTEVLNKFSGPSSL